MELLLTWVTLMSSSRVKSGRIINLKIANHFSGTMPV